MKKILLFLASSAMLLSCSSNVPSTIEEFDTMLNSLSEKSEAEFNAAKEKLEGKQLQDKIEEIYDNLEDNFVDICKKILKKGDNAELCVHALKEISPMMDADDILESIAGLPKEISESEGISKIKKVAENKLRASEGNMFIDFEVDGVKLSDYVGKGKYILVDFWASWCGPCKREIPNIKAVYEKYAGEKFDVLSVAVWDDPEATAAAAAEHGVVWNQIVNTDRIATDAYGITGIPKIMLFGPDGKIIDNDLRGEEIAEAVAEALK